MEIDPSKERRSQGSHRGIWQVVDTITFEFQRNWKKFIILVVIEAVLFALMLILNELEIPLFSYTTGEGLVLGLLTYFAQFFIYIPAVLLGSPSIATDFDKQTGHLLFPRITRGRLMAGRVIGLYILDAIICGVYYLLVAIYTTIKYPGELPIEFVWSLGYALLFALATLSFTILLSSLLKKAGAAMAVGFIVLIEVFLIVQMMLAPLIPGEPWYLLSYFCNIITAIFNMPPTRFSERTVTTPMGEIKLTSWRTPSVDGAIVGLILHTATYLVFAYLRFRRRQLVG